MTTDEKIKELKRQYMRRWKAKNRDKCNEYHRRWRNKNPDKVRQYQDRYWQKKAEQMNFNYCPVCGEPITGKAKFCSPACKQIAYRERQRNSRNNEP